MSALYFYAEDEKHYTDVGIAKIIKAYKITKIVKCFNEEDVELQMMESFSTGIDVNIIVPLYYHKIIVKYFSLIKVVRLPNKNGILTSQDMKFKIKAEEKLRLKLNSSISKPTVNFSHYGGAKDLVEETETINNLFKLGLPVKGIFLAGIPGTGKSFFAKCLAGQLGRFLIELNLTKFMKSDNSIILIEEFFDFFKTNQGDYIIWLDEIEKMFTGSEESTQLLGTLLTKINDFNSSASKSKSTAFIVATANDVYGLSTRNPEFFRNGRFDILLALNPPTDIGAVEILDIYTNACLKENKTTVLYSIYLAFTNELFVSPTSNGLLKNIADYTEDKKVAIDKFIQEHQITDKRTFATAVQNTDSYFTKSISADLLNFKFEFNKDVTIAETFARYRDLCENQSRFPYVPAEIEFLVSSLYKHYLFVDIDITRETLIYFIEKIKPIQSSMRKQIEKMNGVTSDFRQV